MKLVKVINQTPPVTHHHWWFYVLIYLLGVAIVYFFVRAKSRDERGSFYSWEDVKENLVISAFSWVLIAGVIIMMPFMFIKEWIEYRQPKPPKWL
jgi:prolipoprotein diacylglyceryltransferase